MSDELKVAVERFREYIENGGEFEEGREPDSDSLEERIEWRYKHSQDDLWKIANAYLTHLDAQAALDAERAKPIDEDWVATLGVEWAGQYMVRLKTTLKGHTREVWIENVYGEYFVYYHQKLIDIPITTRGDLLDLLAALKVEVRGEGVV